MHYYRRCKEAGRALLILRKRGLKALWEKIKKELATEKELLGSLKARGLSTHSVMKLKGKPKVSIIILSKNYKLLNLCVKSILETTTYKDYEIIAIINNTRRNIEQELKGKMIRYIVSDKKFNFSALNNEAVAHATSEYIMFLNDDTRVITPNWIEALLEQAQQKKVGAVGCKLLYPDKGIQHAGMIISKEGVIENVRNATYSNKIKDCSAVTAACLMVKKSIFQKVGMFDENFPYSFNDVDLCLNIRKHGYVIRYTPFAQLIHYETKSRGYVNALEEDDKAYSSLINKWGDLSRYSNV